MKRIITNILATSAISLAVLSVIATLLGGKYLFINTVYQNLGANILIHIGLMLFHKMEFHSIILETLLDIGYISIILIIFGAVFGWYASTPIWMLILMAAIVYMLSVSIQIFRTGREIQKINDMLHNRNQ